MHQPLRYHCQLFYLQPILHQRELHKIFEQLANSDAVKEQRKILQTPAPDKSAQEIQGLPPGAVVKPITKPWDRYYRKDEAWQKAAPDNTATEVWQSPPSSDEKVGGVGRASHIKVYTPEELQALSDNARVDSDHFIHTPSVVDRGGIKTINWAGNYGVASIETEDGQTLYPTAAPSAWLYLLIALLPLFGFIIPWGVVRAIGWTLAGFVASPK